MQYIVQSHLFVRPICQGRRNDINFRDNIGPRLPVDRYDCNIRQLLLPVVHVVRTLVRQGFCNNPVMPSKMCLVEGSLLIRIKTKFRLLGFVQFIVRRSNRVIIGEDPLVNSQLPS